MERTPDQNNSKSRRRKDASRLAAKAVGDASKGDSVEYKDLSFRVDKEWHSRFKTLASMHGVSMKTILEEGASLWADKKGQK